MATLSFDNVIGVGVGQFETVGYGKMNFPILYINQPINAGDVWYPNSGTSSVNVVAEFSTCRDKVAGASSGTNYMTADGVTVNIDGAATLRRSGGSYVFKIGSVSVTSGFSAQALIETTAAFTAVKGTNNKYAIGSGTWVGTNTEIVYQPCSVGTQGYSTFAGQLRRSGAISGAGPLPLGFSATQSSIQIATDWITNHTTEVSSDPYSQGGESGTGGGSGTFSGTSDNIDFPSLPTLSAVDAGFITLYNPSISELNALASYMWTNPLFDITNWKKIFADPMDAILGLSIVPVDVPSGGTNTVTVGNISTGVSMTTASTQYVSVDCGTLDVKEYWGAYLDYSPYTKAEIYLPYCGTHPLSTDDIMGKSVHVRYHIDILSGACCAYVKCGSSVLYTFVGQCSSSIPITGNDWTNVVNGALSIATSIGTMVATGGAAAPLALPSMANTAANVIKPEVEKSGSMGGTGGMLGIQTPYLILTRPNQAIPKNKNKYSGYPSYITYKLSSLSGFTIVDSIHLSNIPATDDEIKEIEDILKGGVIL
jgi:hypothetical protein